MDDDAPLIGIPEAPVPEGGAARFLRGADGTRHRVALFPLQGARGTVVLSPGRTEPIEKYYEVIDDFRARGFAVLCHDWRGQGLGDRPLPDRLKGHARGWDAYLSDYGRMIDAYAPQLPRPWIAVGHSLGGCLILLALVEGETRLDAAVLSAPMIRVLTGNRPYRQARAMAWVMARTGRAEQYVLGEPNSPFEHTFEANALTRDRDRYLRWRAQLEAHPALGLGGATWGWLDMAFRASARLLGQPGLKRVTLPVTLVGAGADKVVDNAALELAATRLPNAHHRMVPGALHEILIETNDARAQVLDAVDAAASTLQR